jgi:hypothetical protein
MNSLARVVYDLVARRTVLPDVLARLPAAEQTALMEIESILSLSPHRLASLLVPGLPPEEWLGPMPSPSGFNDV